jgi:hypothetical protein
MKGTFSSPAGATSQVPGIHWVVESLEHRMLLPRLLFLIFLALSQVLSPSTPNPPIRSSSFCNSMILIALFRILAIPSKVTQNFLKLSWRLMIRVVARGMNSMVRGTGPTRYCSGSLSTTPQLLSWSKRTLRIIGEGLGIIVGKKPYHGEPQAPRDRTASTLARIRMMVL